MADAVDGILSLAVLVFMFRKRTLTGVVDVENVTATQRAIGMKNARVSDDQGFIAVGFEYR